ncbi:MAG: glutamate--tRNA ligase family protein [Parabacteroides merdae]
MSDIKTNEEEGKKSLNFIEAMVEKDLAEGKNKDVQTRFPPEQTDTCISDMPKPSRLDFGVAQKYGGVCNLRFDDTNPVKEDLEYVDAIKEDIEWLRLPLE